MASLVVDVRERGLIAALTTLGVTFITKALDVGDFLIQAADGRPLLVVERKSHADFAASNAFQNRLFAAQPTRRELDYAKWSLGK